jgi:hypothetical protein
MKVIVAGSRGFTDEALLFATLDKAFGGVLDKVTVISGTARGADQLGEKWAISRGVKLERYPADWDGLGKKAGIVRNHAMGDISTHAILFWDGVSRGTVDMRDYALSKGLWVKVVRHE